MGFIGELTEVVKTELGLPKKPDPKQPICNLHIDINGWQRTYNDADWGEFTSNANRLRVLGKFRGDFRLLRDGSLVYASPDSRFHSYNAEIDLEEVSGALERPDTFEMRPYRMYNLPHIHKVPGGEILGNVHPDSLEELGPMKLMCSFFSRPHYTLKGFYDSLSDGKMHTRINALITELARRRGYSFDSIAVHGKTKLKLLESRYRKDISNQ